MPAALLNRGPATRDYVVRMPHDRYVIAACHQVECDNWRYGWDITLDERTAEGADGAVWIRSGQSGRTFTELGGRTAEGGLTVFRFGPGQRCFTEHRTRRGSWLIRCGRHVLTRHASIDAWMHDLEDHAGQLAGEHRKG
jgi:hypothetical protein